MEHHEILWRIAAIHPGITPELLQGQWWMVETGNGYCILPGDVASLDLIHARDDCEKLRILRRLHIPGSCGEFELSALNSAEKRTGWGARVLTPLFSGTEWADTEWFFFETEGEAIQYLVETHDFLAKIYDERGSE